ncbi:MAG: hypothetical protein WDO73_11670 [Ignavibacteriota bacterium]
MAPVRSTAAAWSRPPLPDGIPLHRKTNSRWRGPPQLPATIYRASPDPAATGRCPPGAVGHRAANQIPPDANQKQSPDAQKKDSKPSILRRLLNVIK